MSVFKSLKNVASSLASAASQSLDNLIVNKDITELSNHALIQFHIDLSKNLDTFPIIKRTQEEVDRTRSYLQKQYEVSDEIIHRFNLYEDDKTRFNYESLHGDTDGIDGIRYALSYFPHKYRIPTGSGAVLGNSVQLNKFLQKLVSRMEMPKTDEERILKKQAEEKIRRETDERKSREAQERYRAYEASPEWEKRQADRKAKGLPPLKSSASPETKN